MKSRPGGHEGRKDTDMKLIRYSRNNGSINIGGRRTKLTIFTRERCACITFRGRRVVHIGQF